MIRKGLLLTISFVFCLIAYFAHAGEVVINKKMKAALKKANPNFVIWETLDYSLTIQKDATEEKRHPYSLTLDVNEDKKDDLILDGHDDKNNILICLLSSPQGYDVIVIRQIDLLNPKELKVYNDGVKEKGLNYYLWPNKSRTGFTLVYPQQSDSEGKLLNDGAMIDYIFKDGKFHESYQTL